MDMYNWDMVCAVSWRELNKKLKAASHNAFGEFSWSDDEGNAISGTFSGWEIVPGGDSRRINIITPLATGRLKIPAMGKDVAVDGLCPKLQVELTFVKPANSENTRLTFNFARVDKKTRVVRAGKGSVVVLDADVNQLFPASGAMMPQLYCQMMAEMLVAMRDNIEFFFAEIMDIQPGSDVSWMKLCRFQYACNETIKGEPGCIAVLGILADNPSPPRPGSLPLIFDSALIREGGCIGFMLSRRMFMQHVVLPGLPDVFAGSDTSQFCLDDDVIRNNGDISLNRLNGYTPYFNRLEIAVLDNRIVLNNTYGRCDVVPYSSYVSFDLSAVYIPQLSTRSGRYMITLASVNRPVFSSEAHDTVAQVFWIFGGWVVDALVQGIRSQMHDLLFESGHRMCFDVVPVKFSTDAGYRECGLADNFYMRD